MVRPFVRHGSQHLLDTPIFRLRRDRAEHPRSGHVGDYYVLENPDWVNIIALTPARELLLVRQWRHGTATIELEIPAGMVEPDESPVAAAARELAEETGYAPARCVELGAVVPNAAYQTNTCHTVLAEGCERVGETRFDPGEDLELVTVPLRELPTLVREGKLRNGMVLVALLWWLDREGCVRWPTE